MEQTAAPPFQGRENRPELFNLLHALCSDPKAQGATHRVFNELKDKGLGTLASEGHTIIRRIIEHSDDNVTSDLQQWVQQLLEQTRDQTPRKKATVSTHKLGPVGITLSMDVIEDTTSRPLRDIPPRYTTTRARHSQQESDWRIQLRIPHLLRHWRM